MCGSRSCELTSAASGIERTEGGTGAGTDVDAAASGWNPLKGS